MARPLPAGMPPLTLRGLRDVIYGEAPACVASPEVFFGPDGDDGEPTADRAARVAVAREICASCPVRLACLAYALRTGATSGVWAGHDADAGELAYLTAAARQPVETVPVRPAAAGVAA
jgi:Transcription factor WhiB